MKLNILTHNSDNYRKALDLLRFYELPTTDINDKNVTLWSAEKETNLLGLVGLEMSGKTGLLRSLAVVQEHQGKGVAKHLCNLVFKHAEDNGVARLFLLTETALDFFLQLGFTEIDRQLAPKDLSSTEQFSSLCPDSASLMLRESMHAH